MKFAVVSDIHGNLPALKAVAAHMAATGAASAVNLGDIVSGPLWPLETAQWLMARGWPTIAGNHERQVLTQAPAQMAASDAHAASALDAPAREWLAALPTALTLGSGRVACCHGTPSSDVHYLLETVTPQGLRLATESEIRARLTPKPRADVLLCGHSHVPRCVTVDGLVLVNPGSVGLPAFADDHGHPHVAETGSPHARWALIERSPNGWRVTLHATPYDHEVAADRAEQQGAADWAHALRTGRALPTMPA